MKPMMILPPGAVNDEDIKRLNDNGICTVVAKEPAAVKFLDPIPATADRGKAEQAAIALSRIILKRGSNSSFYRADVMQVFIDAVLKGTPLGDDAEKEQNYFDAEKLAELRRLAQQEAREERNKAKAEKAAKAKELTTKRIEHAKA